MTDGPIKTLDQQIASAGNSITEAIKRNYGTEPNDISVITNPTTLLSRRFPAASIKPPAKPCKLDVDFLNTDNDLNLSKEIKSLSLDPIMKRLIQEKNNILRAIEGWVASQANDGARQPLLAKTIVDWIKKAVGYMRCGMQILRQINQLISGLMEAINGLIGSIMDQIASDIRAIEAMKKQIANLKNEMEREGIKLVMLAALNFLQDEIALANELMAVRTELMQMKSIYSKNHLHAMKEAYINSFLALIESFSRLVARKQRNQNTVTQLQAALVTLQTTLDNANAVDLSIPMDPGGINPGALNNYTITNDPDLFPDYDALTKVSDLGKWDTLLSDVEVTPHGSSTGWSDIFSSTEPGFITFAANNYGAFQIGLGFDTPAKCPGSSITARLVINGGDWIIQSIATGSVGRDKDDTTKLDYATKNGVFIKVPHAPNTTTRMKVPFEEFVKCYNRPSYFNGVSSVPDPLNPGHTIVVPSLSILTEGGTKQPDYILDLETTTDFRVHEVIMLMGSINWSTLTADQWIELHGKIYRFPSQQEILVLEDNYTTILQTLNTSPTLYKNPTPGATEQTLHFPVPSASHVLSVLQFAMPDDTQLAKTLLGKKPFGGIQIYTNSLNFQLCRQSPDYHNLPRFTTSIDSTLDQYVVRFGLKADWGFAPNSLLS